MKKIIAGALVTTLSLVACQKSNSGDQISLTASSTTATVGQTITVTATTSTNSVSWSATPPAGVSKTYDVTTEKTNYFTFNAPGTYTIGVRARHLELDSIHHCNRADSIGHHFQDSVWNHHIDSLWHRNGHDKGGCKKGQDSASVVIYVK